MTYFVTMEDVRHIRLNETDTDSSVVQGVACILATKRGAVPMLRDYGISQDYIGKPIPIAEKMLYEEISEQIEEFEPRANIIDITFEYEESTGILFPTVEMEVDLDDE